MNKMAALQAQLNRAAGKPEKEKDDKAAPVNSSRAGKVHIGAWLDPRFRNSLYLIKAQTGEDTQTLIAKALNDLFAARNVPVIEIGAKKDDDEI